MAKYKTIDDICSKRIDREREKGYEMGMSEAYEQIKEEIVNLIKIPKRFTDITIEEVQEAHAKYFNSEKGLFLFGPSGTGKTRIAYAILINCVINGLSKTASITMADFLDNIKVTYDDEYRKKENEDLFFRDKEFIILDDLGTEMATEWTNDKVYKLINLVYVDMRRIFITSNMNMAMISKTYGDRVSSRIIEMCEIVKLDGVDKRLK